MKKHCLLTFALLAFAWSSQAQKHFPLPSEHPFWTEKHGSLYGCSCSGCGNYFCSCTMPVYYKTDTLINSQVYNRLYTYGMCTAQYAGGPPPWGCAYMCTHTDPEVLFATIRHDTLNRMVYLWDGSIDRVLYDYNSIAVGQPYPNTYNNPMYPNLKVLAKDSLLLNGSYYKRWILGMSNGGVISDSNFVSVIEGIATTFGIKAPLVPVFENQEELSCFTLHNVNIYPNISYNCDTALQIAEVAEPASFTISPNPAKDMIRITAEVSDSKYKAEVLDMAGRVVLSFTVNAFPCDLKVEDLKTGTYFLKISSERQSSFARFIKM